MSTKIYNGFKLKLNDLHAIHEAIVGFRKELEALHLQELARVIAIQCADMIDLAHLYPRSGESTVPYIKVMGEILDRQKKLKQTMQRDTEVDFDFELVIMPFHGHVYGMVYCERRAWIDLWMGKEFVEEYSYWNNSDHPENVTADEWALRGQIWNDIFAQCRPGTPAMCGFTATCTADSTFPKLRQILAEIPSFDDRLQQRVVSMVSGQKYLTMTETMDKDEVQRHLFSLVIEARQWLKTEDGKAQCEHLRTIIQKIIPREITTDMLTGRDNNKSVADLDDFK